MSGSKIPHYIKEINQVESFSHEKIENYQKDKLKTLLLHAYEKVPYYRKILADTDIIIDEEVNLENFHRIPILTKEIIRREEKNLYSRDYLKRGYYENTSGGSTGEPVRFIQDKTYDEWNKATKIFFNERLGKKVGEKEIKLWGSDRDIIEGNLTLRDRMINFLYNRKFFNCYNFTRQSMIDLLKLNNRFKPKAYWAYVDASYEFSKFILEEQISLISPRILVSTIGPLHLMTRKTIEQAFGCKVYNQYGSRELGAIACQNKEQKELDVFFWRQFVEILDVEMNNTRNQGKLVITTLDNFSMPLIRYEIGDVAIKGEKSYNINQTKSYLSVKDVIGRTLGFFKNKEGSLKHTHFIVQQLFFKDWIKKFQIIQKDYDLIEIKIVGERNDKDMRDITEKIKLFMGTDCNVRFNFVNEIRSTKSGKFLYTVSEI